MKNVRIRENIIYNTIEEELPVIMDTPWGGYSDSVEVTGNLFYTTGTARIFQGTWAGDGLGNWKYEGPINRETFTFKDNAYTSVADHDEKGMQKLNLEASLGGLIDRLSTDTTSTENFAKMVGFLEESRYWGKIEKAM